LNKKIELDEVAKEIKKCPICIKDKIGKPVPGEGNPNAKIVFIGEAPGKEEAKTGRPFIGRSGKFFRSLLKEIGINEKEVFITSPVKYLPKRGTPNVSDILHGRTHLIKQLYVINPEIIVLMGNVAVRGVLEKSIPVYNKHGKVIDKEDKKYLITFHPAAALRFPKIRILFKEDFQKLKKMIGGI